MVMYLVRRYVDELPDGDYGTDDSYYAIGLFTSETKANEVAEAAKAALPADDWRTEINIMPIEVDKIYQGKEQPYLGGGFYIE